MEKPHYRSASNPAHYHESRRHHRLRVNWFAEWQPEIQSFLDELPEMPGCSHTLFRLLAKRDCFDEKRLAVVEDYDGPVAVVCIRRYGDENWCPVTHYIVPESIVPCRKGLLIQAIASLGLDVEIAWWRYSGPPPKDSTIRDKASYITYRMKLDANPERYWKKSGHLNTVRRARKKCSGFGFGVNEPGSAEWVIRQWGDTYEVPQDEIEDRVIAATMLEQTGKHFAYTLSDGDKRVAGHTFLIHQGEVLWHCTCRDREYEKLGVGTRLMDLVFFWAIDSGFQGIDLGGQFAFKRRWASAGGQKWALFIDPSLLRFYRKKVIRYLRRRINRLFKSR